MSMVQLYVSLFDVIPTEGHSVKPVKYEQLADKAEMDHWHYTTWLEDIRKNGINHQTKLHPSGHIGDGNFRYWCLRRLFERNNINNYQWGFMPIDPYYFFGLQRIGQVLNIRKDIWDDLGAPRKRGELRSVNLHTKRKVESGNTQFPDIDMSTLGAGNHPWTQIRGLKFLETNELDLSGGF